MAKKQERKKEEKFQEELKEEEKELKEEELKEQESTEESESQVEQENEDPCAEIEAKLAECEEKFLRTHADFENAKKRLEKEKIQAIEYALEKFAQDLLPALDSLDMALAAVSQEGLDAKEAVEQLKKGIELTIDQFVKAFEKNGIEVIEIEEGGEFNPHLHEAILQVDDAQKSAGQIVQVIQKGYKYKERILRPAKVSVAK